MQIRTDSRINALLVMDPESRVPLLTQMESFVHGIHLAANYRQASEMLGSGLPIQVVLTADTLADGNWSQVLDCVRHTGTGAEVVVCARLGDPRLWCEVIQRGAYDLLAEPYLAAEVQRIVQSAARRSVPRKPVQTIARPAQAGAA